MVKTQEERVQNKRVKLNTHSRAIRLYILDGDSKELIKNTLKPKHDAIFTMLSNYVFQHGKNWTWMTPPYNSRTQDGQLITTFLCHKFKDEFIKNGINKHFRNFVKVVLSNYSSYRGRFKQRNIKLKTMVYQWPSAPIKLKTNKGLRYDDGGCLIKNGLLYIPGLDHGVKFKYSRPSVEIATSKYLNNKTFGGTLIHKNDIWMFTLRYNKQQKYKYTPTEWIGTDFNQTNKDWMTLYIPSIGYTGIPRDNSIQEIEDKILDVNKTLKDKMTTGGKRRYFNKLRIKLHHKHLQMIRPVIRQLCGIAKKDMAGIIIDAVHTGKRTWGQDKIAQLLPSYCVNHGIPCYINNPAYTSITCPVCKSVNKNNRVSVEEFKCGNCGYINNAQMVGALNCYNFGMVSMNL